jgi:hypothetical protein
MEIRRLQPGDLAIDFSLPDLESNTPRACRGGFATPKGHAGLNSSSRVTHSVNDLSVSKIMRHLLLFVGAFAMTVSLSLVSGQAREVGNEGADERDGAKESCAVVELFTSEGCSSCPPADALLAEILQDARKDGRRVFCLSFHVDYWNRLGWTDPYSSEAFSRRQQSYARAMKNDQVYTPQMIVNGAEEFVGSDRRRSRTAIDAALKRREQVHIKLRQGKPKAPASVALSYQIAGVAPGVVLNVALVECGIVSAVKRGENGGRTLRHENVVRVFQTLRLDASGQGTVQLELPTDLVRSKASVITYVQEADTRAILGASALALGPDEISGAK